MGPGALRTRKLLGALGLSLALVACGYGPVESTGASVDPAAQIPPDVPGATREELARVPPQFPLDFAELEGTDAVVSNHQGQEHVRLSVRGEGRADANALAMADQLTALGWSVEPADLKSADRSSVRFQGFGWSGEGVFQPTGQGKFELVIELRDTE